MTVSEFVVHSKDFFSSSPNKNGIKTVVKKTAYVIGKVGDRKENLKNLGSQKNSKEFMKGRKKEIEKKGIKKKRGSLNLTV